jgi:hypothetical protein
MRLALSAEDDEMRQRRARAKASVADLEAEAYAAEARAKTALEAWRKAMVRQLLQPEATTPIPATVVAGEIDFSLLATRKQLIEAFGAFTGMDIQWFDNLTHAPKLEAARKFKGQGSRHSAEPLFCPYEVMQWLADPKRKKGKPLVATTAWRLLKRHFPKVYNHYSIGDPDAD